MRKNQYSKISTFRLFSGALLLLLTSLPAVSLGDVLILNNGERHEGIVTPAPGDPDAYMFQQITGQVKIPKSRIQSVEFEDDATDWRKMGDMYFEAKRYEKALESYKHSEKFDPDSKILKDRIRRAQEALQREATIERRRELATVDEMLGQVKKLIDDKEFAKAENLLNNDLPKLGPVGTQEERLAELRKKLYREWGLEREDKLDPQMAARYYEEYLKLQPADEVIYARLIAIWDRMPEKTEQVVAAHEVQLQLRPDDQTTRKRLADKYVELAGRTLRAASETEDAQAKQNLELKSKELYERAVAHYEHLFNSGEFKGTKVEESLINLLTTLYLQSKREGNYENAITYYKRLQQYDVRSTNEELYKLQYYHDAATIDPNNVEQRVELSLRLRRQNLDTLALQELRRLQLRYPENALVRNAMRLYANEDLESARAAFRTGRYDNAQSLSVRLRDEFGFLEDIKLEADKIYNLATVEKVKVAEKKSELGLQYKELGDQNLAQAQFHISSMRNEEIADSRLINDKSEAIRYLRRAVQYYERAMENRQGLNQAELDSVEDNLTTARRLYSRLTAPLPVRRY